MARYNEAVCRLCRREGEKLYLKGERCNSPKCGVERRSYPPGQHGSKRGRGKPSTYSLQLREKQKAKRMYGVLERQFRRYYAMANRFQGVTGTILLQLLERRLDNVLYRMGLVSSRKTARQLIRHGHFQVNGKKVDIPSFQVNVGDEISVGEKAKKLESILSAAEIAKTKSQLNWLEADLEALKGRILSFPEREDIDCPVQEQMIIELYSK